MERNEMKLDDQINNNNIIEDLGGNLKHKEKEQS